MGDVSGVGVVMGSGNNQPCLTCPSPCKNKPIWVNIQRECSEIHDSEKYLSLQKKQLVQNDNFPTGLAKHSEKCGLHKI